MSSSKVGPFVANSSTRYVCVVFPWNTGRKPDKTASRPRDKKPMLAIDKYEFFNNNQHIYIFSVLKYAYNITH